MKRKPSTAKRKTGLGKSLKATQPLLLTNINITYDDDFLPFDFEQTDEVADAINTYVVLCNKNPQKTVDELPAIIERMPQVPLLRNHLFVALRRLGRHDEAFAVNDQALKDHPDYLYAVLNKAVQHWEKDELDEFEKALGGAPLMINRTFPKREVFHVSEMFAYYSLLLRYWLSKDNPDAAESFYKLLDALDSEHPVLPELKEAIDFSILKNTFGKLLDNIEKSRERRESRKNLLSSSKRKKKGE